jgi:hypothetical protein
MACRESYATTCNQYRTKEKGLPRLRMTALKQLIVKLPLALSGGWGRGASSTYFNSLRPRSTTVYCGPVKLVRSYI